MNSPGDLTREQRLIESICDLTRSEFIGDDCAVLSSSQLLSTDMLVEDQHFKLSYADLESIGWKCIAVNLSDIAAMGGLPTALLVSIGWPKYRSDAQFRQLYSGMQECARKFSVKIVGGDITASEKIVCSITAVGQAFKRGALLRSSAKEGDIVAVTGDFGASACGLESLMKGRRDSSYPISRHQRPQPRLHQGLALSHLLSRRHENGNAALMDTSDGLADAALQISKASGVFIEIEADAIPIHSQTRKVASELGLDPLVLALYGGEDFELLACLNEQVLLELNEGLDCKFAAIGRVRAGSGAQLFQGGCVLDIENSQTYRHF